MLSALHAQDKTLGEIATAMDRPKSVISRKAADAGLSWDRAQTTAATQAKIADGKARRAQLALALLGDAERLRAELWQPCKAFNFGGRDNTYNETTLEQPTFADKLKIIQAAAVAVDKALRLEEYDSGDAGGIGSLLGSLFAGLQAKHGAGDDA